MSSSSSSEDELSHFRPSGLLYTTPSAKKEISTLNYDKNRGTKNIPTNPSLLKYYECEDSCVPIKETEIFKLFVFKDTENLETHTLNTRSYYRLGRDSQINHIILNHESISSQHAVLQYRHRSNQCKLYVIDLDSSNGTQINNEVIEGKRFYEILDGDVVKFGASTRDYVFMKTVDKVKQ